MARPLVFRTLTTAWQSVEGAAANQPGAFWQNLSQVQVQIAFTTAAPAGGPADAYHILNPSDYFTDTNGSAKVWARSLIDGGIIACTAD